jgi:hypothetical protein
VTPAVVSKGGGGRALILAATGFFLLLALAGAAYLVLGSRAPSSGAGVAAVRAAWARDAGTGRARDATTAAAPPADREKPAEPVDMGAPAAAAEIDALITVAPATATVTLNGQPMGNPVKTRMLRAPGESVLIQASAPGFQSETRTAPRDGDIALALSLKPERKRGGGTKAPAMRIKKDIE